MKLKKNETKKKKKKFFYNKIDLVQINLVVRCKDNPYDYCDYYEKDDLKGH